MIAIMQDLSEKEKAHYEALFSASIITVDQELIDTYPDITILVSKPVVSAEFLAHFPNLKLIFTVSAGVNKMPFAYLEAHNIMLANSRGLHAEHMSEHALAMMLVHTRQLTLAIKNQEQHHWSHASGVFSSIQGKSLCIVGAGSIGDALARKATALGMRVTGVSRSGKANTLYDKIYQTGELTTAVATADIVVLLVPLTPETHHLFNASVFSAMKKQSMFINISRGGTVDEAALVTALTDGTLVFCGLDVFGQEPLGEDSVFWDMPNVLITPHTAGEIDDYFDRAMHIFKDVLTDFRAGTAVRNQVDLAQGY